MPFLDDNVELEDAPAPTAGADGWTVDPNSGTRYRIDPATGVPDIEISPDEPLRPQQMEGDGNAALQEQATGGIGGTFLPDDAELDEEPSLADDAIRGTGLTARSILRGIGTVGDFVTMPVDALYGLIGLPQQDVRGALDEWADKIGLPRPQSGSEKFVSALGEGATGGALTAGLAAPAAALPGVAGAVAGELAAAPVAATLSGAVGAGSSELAAQAGAGPLGQAAAGLAGGGVAAVGPSLATRGGRAVANMGRNVVDTMTPAGAERRAADILQRAATGSPDEIATNIRMAPTPVPGVAPTLAEVAGDAGIAGMQRGHANTNLNTAAALSERAAANALARTRAASGTMGEGSPQVIQDIGARQLSAAEQATLAQQLARQQAIEARLAQGIAETGDATMAAQRNLAAQIERLGVTADRDVTGAAARDAYERAYQAAKERTREAYSVPELKKPEPLKLPRSLFLKLRDAADDFYGDGGGEIPQRLQAVLSDMASDTATTRTLTNIDRRLADFAGEANMQGRRAEAAFAERVRRDLGEAAEAHAPAPYRKALRAAKEVRAEQGRIFEAGPVAQAMERDRFRNPVVRDTSVPGRLVRPGAAGGDVADALIKAVGPEAAEQIVRQEIRRVAEEGAVATADKARALAVRYGEAARRFASVRADLRNLEVRAAELDAARSAERGAVSAKAMPEEVAAAKQRHALHDAILDTPLWRVTDPNIEPSAFVAGLMRRDDGGRQLRQLYSQIKDNPDAVAGLRRALGNYIEEAGAGNNFTAAGDRVPSINNTRKAIQAVLSRAGTILTPEQRSVLSRVNRELEKANFATTASKPAGSETEINRTFKGLMHFVPGSGIIKNVLGRVLETLSNGEEVKRVLTQAILEPEFAATLLKSATPQRLNQVSTTLQSARSSAMPVLIAATPERSVAAILQDRLSRSASGMPLAAEEQNDQGQ